MATKGRIERLSQRLDSRTRYEEPKDAPEPILESSSSAEAVAEPAPMWETPPIDDYLAAERRKPEPYPLMKKVFIISLLFAFCASGAAALIYFKGDNFISTKNLDIGINAPVNISAGSPVDMQITVTNKNNASITDVNLTVVFPDGTKSAERQSADLPSINETIDSLGSGEKKNITSKAVFFGSEGEVKTVRVSVDYKVSGSNAVFTKEKSFDMTIGSAPVSVTTQRPEVVNSGEPFTLTFNITSNSEETLQNTVFKVEYPYGFSVSSASPTPNDPAQSVWVLGDLAPGQKQTVTLHAIQLGEDQDERTLRYMVGLGNSKGITTTLSSDTAVLTLSRPAIDFNIALNGDTDGDYIAPAGKPVQVTINFKNNLPSNFLNPQIQVTLGGVALDRSSVVPQNGGFYNSTSNSVVWNGTNYDALKVLHPGDTGSVSFSFNTLTNLSPTVTNPQANLSFSLTGKEQDSGNSRQVSDSRNVKVASAVVLDSKSLYSKGPMVNTGPIPPKAENETTYTIALSLTNTQNEVVNGDVTGTLGPNVKWLGSEDPSITYDDKTNTFDWEVGTLASGVGFSSPVKQAYFRVSLTPSLGQVGGVPALINNLAFEGLDSFTKANVRITNPSVTTSISTDPSYIQGDETVVK